MTIRLPPFLASAMCGLLLVGCTSPKPENMSPTPPIESTAMPGFPATPALAGQIVGETGQAPTGGPVGPATAQQGHNCRTVGNATMCDAPAIAPSEDRHYTN